MKTLYESLIDRAQRHGLGEYYTPDWLAAKMAKRAIASPLEQKVLDPACGSGTFLFHAIRLCLAEAEESGTPREMRASDAATLVAGIDIHPVAVIIARVTCLLALSPVLAARRGRLKIPVYLGDAMQLAVSQHFADTTLSIRVPQTNGEPAALLDFPEVLCRDPDLFDGTVEILRRASENALTRGQFEARIEAAIKQRYADLARRFPNPVIRVYGDEEARAVTDIGATYVVYDRLRRKGRDTIWPYVARNLSRPLSLSAGGGWANVVIGNPPWVAFRHMSDDLQKRFKELAKGVGVFVGRVPSQNDLCALFTARSASLYLRGSGRLAFVLPLAALTRGQFERLRSGAFQGGAIQWEETWTMDDSVQPLFPVPSCAVFGRRRASSKAMPERVRAYSGPLPLRDAPEALVDRLIADNKFSVTEDAPKPSEAVSSGGSVYRKLFRNGATLFPRMLCLVERKQLGRIGPNPAAPLVTSRRTQQEKKPWNELLGIENQVEAEFLRPVLLGESIVPFRLLNAFEGAVPVDDSGVVLDSGAALGRGFDHLAAWMQKAEAVWNRHRRSERYTLVALFDYFAQLSSQFPIRELRVVYAASGTNPAACVIEDNRAVVEHKLYWTAPADMLEARYLCAILNSEAARSRAAAYQSRGQWGARDFDKVMFNLPIPRFDPKTKLHRDLAVAAERAETIAAAVPLPEGVKFQRARAMVRAALAEAGVSETIDRLVEPLLDGGWVAEDKRTAE
jgi:SAM-dependent methyltransferase